MLPGGRGGWARPRGRDTAWERRGVPLLMHKITRESRELVYAWLTPPKGPSCQFLASAESPFRPFTADLLCLQVVIDVAKGICYLHNLRCSSGLAVQY